VQLVSLPVIGTTVRKLSVAVCGLAVSSSYPTGAHRLPDPALFCERRMAVMCSAECVKAPSSFDAFEVVFARISCGEIRSEQEFAHRS
jgi:hypothetical protein